MPQSDEQKEKKPAAEQSDGAKTQKEEAAKEQGICWQFQHTGTCWFGDRCRFKHEKDDGAKSGTKEVCRFFRNNGWCGYGDSCKFEHEKGVQGDEREICKHFSRTGKCSLGDDCKMKHVKENQDGASEICTHFARTGECWFGDRCKFRHDERERFYAEYQQALHESGGEHDHRRTWRPDAAPAKTQATMENTKAVLKEQQALIQKVLDVHSSETSKLKTCMRERDALLEDLIKNTKIEQKGEMQAAIEETFKIWREELEGRDKELRKREETMKGKELRMADPKLTQKEAGERKRMELKIVQLEGTTKEMRTKIAALENEKKVQSEKAEKAERERKQLSGMVKRLENEKTLGDAAGGMGKIVEEAAERVAFLEHEVEALVNESEQQKERILKDKRELAVKAAETRQLSDDKSKLTKDIERLSKTNKEKIGDLSAQVKCLESKNSKLGNERIGQEKNNKRLTLQVAQLMEEKKRLENELGEERRRGTRRGVLISQKGEFINALEKARAARGKKITEQGKELGIIKEEAAAQRRELEQAKAEAHASIEHMQQQLAKMQHESEQMKEEKVRLEKEGKKRDIQKLEEDEDSKRAAHKEHEEVSRGGIELDKAQGCIENELRESRAVDPKHE
eukprot:gene8805-21524_t